MKYEVFFKTKDYIFFKESKNSKSNYWLNSLIFKDLSIIVRNNKFILKNLYLDKNYLIKKVDNVNLEFIDKQNKKNNILLKKVKENNYKITGSSFNADKLIDNLLAKKKRQ